ncbi:hypothetical protein FKW77_009887 [Venturia effusa]|uniref:CENP-T/Histone H4 histone fold domain-containing protein n=1 Tax=Venturia effusa TaxID=50376 RepID=A0A517KXG9_9PEZI|nr:hypothetical protein FKW77_009887 [Venturia effusa]
MSEPSKKKPRITEDLHTLGRLVHKPNTPQARTPVPQTSANRIYVRTPGSAAATRTPTAGASTHRVSRRGRPTTPHAIRALQQRRNAALTPGGNRRRSGWVQRETPRDDLRQLSRVLAKTSKPAQPSPAQSAPRRHSRSILDDQDELSPVDRPPRLSMALGDLDDDSFHENPPRSSHNWDQDEDTFENPRRALNNARDRRSLGGFGELSFQDLNELGMDDRDRRMAIEAQELMGEDEVEDDLDDELDMDGETGELRELMNRRQSGRSEDIAPGSSPGTTGEPTFLFRIPERTRNSLLPPAVEDQDQDHSEDELRPVQDADEAQYEDDGYEDIYDEEVAAKPLRGDSPAPEVRPRTEANKSAIRARKELKVSRHGIEYPSLPPTVIKRLASTFARSYGGTGKLNKETLTAISQTSDWFFEQISEDLSAYADHAGRKTIEESDVITLMKRQRLLNNSNTPFSLAQKFLPRELLQEVRMAPPSGKSRKRKRSRLETIDEE